MNINNMNISELRDYCNEQSKEAGWNDNPSADFVPMKLWKVIVKG